MGRNGRGGFYSLDRLVRNGQLAMARNLAVIGLLAILSAGAATPAAHPAQAPAPPVPPHRACAPGLACCKAALQGFCRIGCAAALPKLIQPVAPDLTEVARPYPSGVVILEVGIDAKGQVVSACVLRGVRSDFDKAAQAAALRWRWNPTVLDGKPVGVVMTVTVCTPDLNCARRQSGGRGPAQAVGPSAQPP